MNMTRSQIINSLIKKYDYKTYLEIGVNTPAQPGYNWKNLVVDLKHGVDPNPKVGATFPVTSDEFFAKHITMKYDIVFVDGLHVFDQAYRDIINSLKNLNEGGTIVVHDCNPLKEEYQRPVHTPGIWLGDVWKAILKLRMEEPNLKIYVVDTDFGCGIIQQGSQQLFDPKKYFPKGTYSESDIHDFNFLNAHRKEILQLISPRKFKTILGTATALDKVIVTITDKLGL